MPDQPPREDDLPEQRRHHVRVDLLRRCAVALPRSGQVAAELVDLSGTGCGFLTRATPVVGDAGRVRIQFEDWTFDAPFEVRFVRPPRADEPGRTYVGVQFQSLSEQEIDDVVREVFATMRRQLRNTRGG